MPSPTCLVHTKPGTGTWTRAELVNPGILSGPVSNQLKEPGDVVRLADPASSITLLQRQMGLTFKVASSDQEHKLRPLMLDSVVHSLRAMQGLEPRSPQGSDPSSLSELGSLIYSVVAASNRVDWKPQRDGCQLHIHREISFLSQGCN